MPTLELARLSDGEIIAVDIDPTALDELERKAREAGLSSRITGLNRSMQDLDFSEESFDVIWCEGAAFVIGFSNALRDWRKFIKPGGFLVIHEAIWLRPNPPDDIARHWQQKHGTLHTASHLREEIRTHGYELIEWFALPSQLWWDDYFEPLERLLRGPKDRRQDPELQSLISDQQRDVEMFRKSDTWYGSAFFVMRKNGS